MSSQPWRELKPSAASQRTSNPIRAIVDRIQVNPNHPLPPLKLSIGDPTIDGNLLPPANYLEALHAAIDSHKRDGYANSIGYDDAREAVAKYFCQFAKDKVKGFTADDVILASGASHAIEMAIGALCDEGDEILVPAPAFSLYGVICSNKGIKVNHYTCNPEKEWAPDIDSIKRQFTPKTKAILINNPSNPCGSNFTRQNVQDLVSVAEQFQLPIISDEIYAGMCFHIDPKMASGPPPEFVSVSAVSDSVPCLVIGGCAKNFVVPGHRMGWVLRHDPKNRMAAVWQGVRALSTLIVGPNTIIQAGLPSLLLETDPSYDKQLKATLAANAWACYSILKPAKGLHPVLPQGAMYMMVRVDFEQFNKSCGVTDDVTFSSKLMEVKNVQVLPGSIFKAPGFVRIVYTKPVEQLKEACKRIIDFTKENTH